MGDPGVALAAGVREATVSLGAGELDSGAAALGRARRPGGGRKRLADLNPRLRPALLALNSRVAAADIRATRLVRSARPCR
jgi:hypothetical protein